MGSFFPPTCKFSDSIYAIFTLQPCKKGCPLQAWLMESPRWLLLSGAPREEAVAALERARGKYSTDSAAVEKEATAISRSLQSAETQAAGASGAMITMKCLLYIEKVRRSTVQSREVQEAQASDMHQCKCVCADEIEGRRPEA